MLNASILLTLNVTSLLFAVTVSAIRFKKAHFSQWTFFQSSNLNSTRTGFLAETARVLDRLVNIIGQYKLQFLYHTT